MNFLDGEAETNEIDTHYHLNIYSYVTVTLWHSTLFSSFGFKKFNFHQHYQVGRVICNLSSHKDIVEITYLSDDRTQNYYNPS